MTSITMTSGTMTSGAAASFAVRDPERIEPGEELVGRKR